MISSNPEESNMLDSQELEEKAKTARRAVLEGLGKLCKQTKTRTIVDANGFAACLHSPNETCACQKKKAG